MDWDEGPGTFEPRRDLTASNTRIGTLQDAEGLDFFIQVDVGVEFEFNNVLIDVMWQNVLQTTRGIAPEGVSESAFADESLYEGGVAIHVGYGLW